MSKQSFLFGPFFGEKQGMTFAPISKSFDLSYAPI